jgi:CheY-like chemotaxis protein
VREGERFKPDLVLMDLRLPGEHRRPRSHAPAPRSPATTPTLAVIAVSASAYDLDRSECFTAGCDAFLAKPFREEELWTMMERFARASCGASPICRGDASRRFALAVQPPPPAEANALYELAAKGDVVGIRARAAALVTNSIPNTRRSPRASSISPPVSR